MTTVMLLALVMAAGSPGGGQAAATPEAQVRDAERAFAKTMADRDHAAFVSFLSEDAVFLGSDRVLRGRSEVAEGWKRYYEGPRAPFAWEPERVEVIASGSLAISTGPVRDQDGKQIGTFTSTWRRERDGRWRVVLDSGCPPCECRSAARPWRSAPAS